MTATRNYHAPDGTFRKVLPPDRARREVAGWRAVATMFPVPLLRDVRDVADGCEVVYEDVFAAAAGCWLTASTPPTVTPATLARCGRWSTGCATTFSPRLRLLA